ncbi:lysine-specific demethylase JMJ25-like protein [Tanacetum coccineum]
MAEKGEGVSIPNELRCKRSDGRKWRCKLRASEGRGYCEAHLQQGKLRSRKQPVPDGLKLKITNKRIKKESSNINEILKVKEEIEDGDDNNVFQDLVHGQMEINRDKNQVKNEQDGFLFRIGASSLVYRRPIRSKNVEPVPDVTIKDLVVLSNLENMVNISDLDMVVNNHEKFRDRYLHSDIENLKNTMRVRIKKVPSNYKSWSFFPNGDIRCPPKSLGGCGQDFLQLKSLYPFGYTKDLESSAKEIVHKYNFNKPFTVDSLSSIQCGTYDEAGSAIVGNLIKNKGCFPITKEFIGKNLKDHLKHWGKGQPLVIGGVLQDHQNLNWNFNYIICEYLKKSAEY